jgi:hippurate hydrolase
MRTLVLAVLTILLTVSAAAQTIAERVDVIVPKLVDTYKQLHQTPELSTKEEKTSAFLASRLRDLGYEVTETFGRYEDPNATCYGVVAVLRNGKGPTVLVRSDMDALPVLEQTGLEYASRNEGVMHACGHDVHMTTLLGTAEVLAAMKSKWRGTLILIGQPAEEVVKGARAMLDAGLYERFGRPDYAIALHDWATVPAGKVGFRSGYFLSAADSIDITLRGVGGHGASPQAAKDPVVLAAETVLALQTIVSRERSPLDPVVVTVGKIDGGTKRNIIPDDVRLHLTVRTFRPEVRERVLESIHRIPRGLAIAAGVPEDRMPVVNHLLHESIGSTYNDPKLTTRIASIVSKEIGDANVIELDQQMVSEDFSLFGGDIPAVLLSLGAGDPAAITGGTQPGLHSAKYAPIDPALTLRTGVRTAVAIVLDLMK